MIENLSHQEEAEELLLEQFKRSSNLINWLSAYIAEVQELESVFYDLYTMRAIDTATGSQLDGLGSIVGQERDGLGDTDYRIRIKTRIRINKSSGLDIDIKEVFALMLSDNSPPITIEEYYPASMIVRLNEYLPDIDPDVLAEALEETRAAAVQTHFVYLSAELSETFSHASGDLSEWDQVGTWAARSAPTTAAWRSVAWSPSLSLFAAIAQSGSGVSLVMTSPDGDNWTMRSSANGLSWRQVIWAPELALFVAVANGGTNPVMTSPDGITWTARSADSTSGWYALTWSPTLSLLAAVSGDTGTNKVMTSPDGITWTVRTGVSSDWRSVTWSTQLGLFVAVASSGANKVMTSPDGITWTARTASASQQWWGVAWSPTLSIFAAVSRDGANRVMTSPDGITWTARSAAENNAWRRVIWSASASMFVAVSEDGTNRVMVSQDGILWYSMPASEANQWLGVAEAPSLGVFVAVAIDGANRVMKSLIYGTSQGYGATTGEAWFACVSGFGTDAIKHVIYESSLGLWVAVGANGKLSTSTDGITWTARTSQFSTDTINRVMFANGLFVAIGANGKLSTSPDGITWTARTSQFSTTEIHALTFAASLWVIVGASGKVSTSPDGITWTSRTSGATDLRDVTYGEGVFAACGERVITSPDGVTWTSRVTAVSLQFRIIYTAAKDLWTVVGDSGEVRYTSGITLPWNIVAGMPPYTFNDVVYSSTLGVVIACADGGVILTSPAGDVWTQQADGFGSTDINRLLATADCVVAVGDAGTVTLGFDGLTWIVAGASQFGANNINHIAQGNNKLVIVGAGGKLSVSSDSTSGGKYAGVVEA